jgi:hypothetical protein
MPRKIFRQGAAVPVATGLWPVKLMARRFSYELDGPQGRGYT